jgi:hypothetical protein
MLAEPILVAGQEWEGLVDDTVVLVGHLIIPIEVGDARAALHDVMRERCMFLPILNATMAPEGLHAAWLLRRRRRKLMVVRARTNRRRVRCTTSRRWLLQHLRRCKGPLIACARVRMRERIHASHLRHLALHTLNLSSYIFSDLPRLHLPL